MCDCCQGHSKDKKDQLTGLTRELPGGQSGCAQPAPVITLINPQPAPKPEEA